MIPRTFNEWKHCIEHDCNIALTAAFVASRLAVYEDPNNPETKKFKDLYGEQHLNSVIIWLKQI